MPTLFRTNNDNHEEFKNNLLPDKPTVISSPGNEYNQNLSNSAENQNQPKKEKTVFNWKIHIHCSNSGITCYYYWRSIFWLHCLKCIR